ncbi:MAG: cobaltochelatase subunit CobN [Thermodesulforhabdaceae bacterium]
MKEKLLTFLVNSALTETLWEGYELFRNNYSLPIKLSIFSTQDVDENSSTARDFEASLLKSDMVFLDVRGGGKSVGILHRTLPRTSQPVVLLLGGSPEVLKLLRLGSLSFDRLLQKHRKSSDSKPSLEPNLAVLQKITAIIEKIGSILPFGQLKHMRNWVRMMTYWNNGGSENISNLIAFAAKEYLGFRGLSVPKPRIFPELAIYDPLSGEIYTSGKAYFRKRGLQYGKPTVGILFYSGMHLQQSLVPARAITRALQSRDIQVIPVIAKTGGNLKAVKQFFMRDEASLVDAVIYLQWFQLTTFTSQSPDESISLLKKLNVPIITGCPMYGGKISSWEESDRGLTPVEVLTTVVLPELDGMIEPIPTAGLQSNGTDGTAIKKVVPISDSIEYLANRVANWISLRHKTNQEKRVAFVIYDNPPGEDNLGSAAYLDTFASIERILKEMQNRGYRVDNLPADQSLSEYLVKRLIVNTPRWGDIRDSRFGGRKLSTETYKKFRLPNPARNEVVTVWGNPPGSVMAENGKIFLPVVEFGNILIGVVNS